MQNFAVFNTISSDLGFTKKKQCLRVYYIWNGNKDIK